MRLVCPSCGATHSAEAWANDPEARLALARVSEMPHPVGVWALPYLALFRDAKNARALQWRKTRRLAEELSALVASGWIQRERKPARQAPPTVWAQALERIVDRPPGRLPLTSHGYLCTVAYDLADDADRAAETARNLTERAGTFRREYGPKASETEFEPLDKDWMRSVRAERMGKGR